MGDGKGTSGLHERLLSREEEIRRAIFTRVYAVSSPSDVGDPAYTEGLRAAVGAAIDYGLEGVQSSERNLPPVPTALPVQARVAARNGVTLDTVLRRCFAGYALFEGFLLEEVEALDTGERGALRGLWQAQALAFDRLLKLVSEEYARESADRFTGSEERRIELVQRLLAGERLDAAGLAYDFVGVHTGLLAAGEGVEEALRRLAKTLGHRLLFIRRSDGTIWAWLGGRRAIRSQDLQSLLPSALPASASLALGEPSAGFTGWRLSHRQALAAFSVLSRSQERFVRYVDVSLPASIPHDDLLATSLREIYLKPLQQAPDKGRQALETLRTYCSAGRNISSTASALGVNRKTVASRLRTIEVAIGEPISLRLTEIEVALRINADH